MLAIGSYSEKLNVLGVEEAGREGLRSAYSLIQSCDAVGTMLSIRDSVGSKIDVVPAFLELIIQLL